MKTLVLSLATTLGAHLCASDPALAQCPLEQLAADDPRSHSAFGDRVAVSGDFLVVGAPLDDEMGQDSGAAHVFELIGGELVEVRKLLPPTGEYGLNFGRDVAMDGDRLLVGSGDNRVAVAAGAGYLYRRGEAGWVLEDTLLADDPRHGQRLGASVAVQGERAVLGAPGLSGDVGHVLVFEKGPGGWSEVARLDPAGPEEVRGFGSHVETSGDRILVHAVYSGGGAALYVFELAAGGWAPVARLQGHDAGSANGHSNGIALQGDVAVLSVPHGDPGASYVFERIDGTWTETTKLVGSGDPRVDFGSRTDLRGDRLAVGGLDLSFLGIGEEYVEVFRRSGDDWTSETRLTRIGQSSARGFGSDLALWRDSILVGSPDDSMSGPDSGGVHVYNLAHATETICDALPSSIGTGAETRLECGATVTTLALRASPMPSTVGLFFSGQRSAHLPSWNGVRCVTGTLVRMPILPVVAGELAHDLDVVAPVGGTPWIRPGSTWLFQAWFRDPTGAGANFSSGLSVTFAP